MLLLPLLLLLLLLPLLLLLLLLVLIVHIRAPARVLVIEAVLGEVGDVTEPGLRQSEHEERARAVRGVGQSTMEHAVVKEERRAALE